MYIIYLYLLRSTMRQIEGIFSSNKITFILRKQQGTPSRLKSNFKWEWERTCSEALCVPATSDYKRYPLTKHNERSDFPCPSNQADYYPLLGRRDARQRPLIPQHPSPVFLFRKQRVHHVVCSLYRGNTEYKELRSPGIHLQFPILRPMAHSSVANKIIIDGWKGVWSGNFTLYCGWKSCGDKIFPRPYPIW